MAALLEEHDDAIVRALERDGIDAREVHAEVRRALGTGDERLWEGILVTPRVRKIVRLAEERAGEAREVEPADLLAALREEGGSRAAAILRHASGAVNVPSAGD